MVKILLLFCLLVISTLQAPPARSATVILTDHETTIDLNSNIEIFKPDQDYLDIKDVSSPSFSKNFIPTYSTAQNYGYSHGGLWVRFNIKKTSGNHWYLVIDHIVQDEAKIFILPVEQGEGELKKQITPLYSIIENNRTPAWKLNLPNNKTFSIYLKITNPKNPLITPLKVMQDNQFIELTQSRYMFFSVIMAGMILLPLYNLFLAFYLKDRSYIFFALFVFALGTLIYRGANLFPSSINIMLGPQNNYSATHLLMIPTLGILYWYKLHEYTEKFLSNCTKWMAIFSGGCMVFALFYPQNAGYFLVVVGPCMLILPILMVKAIIKGHRGARTSFIPLISFLFSVGVYAPLYTGRHLDYPTETFYIGYFGFLISTFLLSINHADRSRQIRIKAERAEENHKATHNFLTTMSHELRTPMHTIIGANELLKSTPLSKIQNNYLRSSSLASEQLMKLVDDILNTAKLHSKSANIKKIKFNLYTVLESIENIFSIQAQRKNLNFNVKIGSHLPGSVIGDERYLIQVITNLIRNAIKYTDSGEITLLVDRDLEANAAMYKKNFIKFSVIDTGPGIPKKHHDLLFEPFYQTDNSRSRRKDGAGLGLSISHKLVQQMGGELKLDSTMLKGSCFFFTLDLPIYNKKPQVKKSKTTSSIQKTPVIPKVKQSPHLNTDSFTNKKSEKAPLLGRKILLVDDADLNLMIGKQLLFIQGAKVTTAQSGQEALEMLKTQSFDLVLMDISMPDMDGYQTTQLLREQKDLRALPVIALTAHAIAGERERCLEAGMNDYLSKPFEINELATLIEKHCTGYSS